MDRIIISGDGNEPYPAFAISELSTTYSELGGMAAIRPRAVTRIEWKKTASCPGNSVPRGSATDWWVESEAPMRSFVRRSVVWKGKEESSRKATRQLLNVITFSTFR